MKTIFRNGFLYKEYKNNVYFWEFIKMFEKLLIIIILNWFDDNVMIRGHLVFLIVLLYDILAKKYRPYEYMIINNLDKLSTLTCALSIILCVFIYKNPYNYLVWIGYLLIIAINIYFFYRIFR